MPRLRPRSRASDGGATVIELSIPMRMVRGGGAGGEDNDDENNSEEDEVCYICANSFCRSESCGRALTHLACCTQSLCCACLLKSSKRCMCKEDCDAVIVLCPFCREVAPVETLDVFLGHKPPCASCVKSDATTAAPPPPPPVESDDLENT